jgi:hypothetical protein
METVILYNTTLVEGKIDKEIYYKDLENNKVLKIPVGTKPMKALRKVIEFFPNCEEFNLNKKTLETYCIELSRISNTKKIKGNLVISIHPMDFLTMSDNDSRWESCMSWTHYGCYRMGTEEMMNSNNVVVCYLESDKNPDYYFSKKKEVKDDAHKWNNKKWRQLFYINKDIIVSGKSYPYFDEHLTFALLNSLRELAKKNMNWKYSFGPQRYKDMIAESAFHDFDAMRIAGSARHKILFHTKAMYNDMANDKGYPYYCVRNKVKKSKFISISGKHKCLCCGETNSVSVEVDDDYVDGYNDRYSNCDSLICSDCLDDFRCSCCNETKPLSHFIKIKGKKCCKHCYTTWLRICPDCGEIFDLRDSGYGDDLIIKLFDNNVLYKKFTWSNLIEIARDALFCRDSIEDVNKELYLSNGFASLYMCHSCKKEKFLSSGLFGSYDKIIPELPKDGHWGWTRERYGKHISYNTYDLDDEKISKYLVYNLKKPSLEDEKTN